MAKKKVQVLLDEQEARQIYDKVDWNWLFNFVRMWILPVSLSIGSTQ